MAFTRDVFDLYKSSNEAERVEIHKKFMKLLWKSNYKKYKVKRDISYTIDRTIADDAIVLFSKYANQEFKFLKSRFDGKKMTSVDFIRVHLNNMYCYNCDDEVYLDSGYYECLAVAKQEYFKYIHSKEKEDLRVIESRILDSLSRAKEIKMESINKKHLEVSWTEFKILVDSWIKRIMENYKGVDDEKFIRNDMDGDEWVTKYINKSLTWYFITYLHSLENKKYKRSIGAYISLDHILDEYNIFMLSVGKYCSSIEEAKKLEYKSDLLTKNQQATLKAIELILLKYKLKEVILFNEKLVPYINHSIIAREIGIDRKAISKKLKNIYKRHKRP